jgi:hypothetical protein
MKQVGIIGSRRELCNVPVSHSLCLSLSPPQSHLSSSCFHRHLLYSSAGNYVGYEPYNVFPRNGTAITTI